jgi:CIC family chloride channel protein
VNTFKRYTSLFQQDLRANYSRDIQKWLIVAPIIGVLTGLVMTGFVFVVLEQTWARVLPQYFEHHWLIVPGLVVGFLVTGLIMQYLTPDPNEHSTEEIIRSYHEHEGDIDIRPFWWKLLAAATTVGSGGSCALEGPGIYAGGAIGSWLWTRLGRLGLEPRDRRLMLISGAAAGMSAVFRAPLTGMVFAMEMPYKDDLAHEALLPSLISSVVSYATLISFTGAQPLFGFADSTSFRATDLVWAAILGAGIGAVALVFDLTFRHVRTWVVRDPAPHALKMALGGLGTGVCGLLFVSLYNRTLIPIGPNYEAVREVLARPHASGMLVVFAALKMAATVFSLGSGGVSAMFVPLILIGGCIGNAFGQSVVHASAVDLYAACGMTAFIASGYKTPLTAVVFVAETTGGHSYLIPSLIAAAIAYAVSGEASVSGEQRWHEIANFEKLTDMKVADVMQQRVVGISATATLRDFAQSFAGPQDHTYFPVCQGKTAVGIISTHALARVPVERWDKVTTRELAEHNIQYVSPDCDLYEALRQMVRERGAQMLMVVGADGSLRGIVTKTDILRGLTRQSIARR